jgi:hypothetical protein
MVGHTRQVIPMAICILDTQKDKKTINLSHFDYFLLGFVGGKGEKFERTSRDDFIPLDI